jgi:hypothetical protein
LFVHPDVTPAAVFFREGAATAVSLQNGAPSNQEIDTSDYHATAIAGVMIANNDNESGIFSDNWGVASGADLYSAAVGTLRANASLNR